MGRVITQAASRWLATAAARVRARVWSSGICGGESGAGAGFLLVFWFPLPIFIPLNSPSSPSLGAGTICQKWPTCRMDPVWTPHPTMRIKKKNIQTKDSSLLSRQSNWNRMAQKDSRAVLEHRFNSGVYRTYWQKC
jgi:hypothetical protein